MPARLLCRIGPLRGSDFDLDREATLGRHPECTVVLPVPAVSGRHARIAWDDAAGRYFLEDLGSLNGTELDGEPLTGRERLDRLHVITLGGKLDLIFQGPELCAPSSQTDAETGATDSVDSADSADSRTLIDELPVELPAALEGERPAGSGTDSGTGSGAGAESGSGRTELDLEILPLPGSIDPQDHEPPEGDDG
jgi:hypothetical protein